MNNKKAAQKVTEELLEQLAFTLDLIRKRGGNPNDLYLLDIDKKYFEPIKIPEDIDPDFAKFIEDHNKHGIKTLIELRDAQLEYSQSFTYAYDSIQKSTKMYEDHIKDKHECSEECLAKIGLDENAMNICKKHVKKVSEVLIKHLEDQMKDQQIK